MQDLDGTAQVDALAVASLVGLSRAEKITTVLAVVYAVHDPCLAAQYLRWSEEAGYSTSQLISAMLQIAPVEIEYSRKYKKVAKQSYATMADLLARSDSAHHKAIEQAFEKKRSTRNPNAGYEPSFSLVDASVRMVGDWSDYFSREATMRRSGDMTISDNCGRHLIAVDHPECGLLTGPGVVFNGDRAANGSMVLSPGWVLFGSRLVLPSGRYRLQVDLEVLGADMLRLDVVADRGLRKLFEINAFGVARFGHEFELAAIDQELEIRISNLLGRYVNAKLNKIVVETKELGLPYGLGVVSPDV